MEGAAAVILTAYLFQRHTSADHINDIDAIVQCFDK